MLTVDSETPLHWVLREQLGLTGTKYSCGIAECGACTVHLDGEARLSCVTPVGEVAGTDIITIEGFYGQVDVQFAPAEAMYKNPAFNTQMTAASTSVRTSWDILRKAGATAREMLIAAAAGTWNVPAGQCRAETGMVIHNQSQRKLGYGELASKAAQLPIPDNVTLKKPEDFRIIGHSYLRLDMMARIYAMLGLIINSPDFYIDALSRAAVLGLNLNLLQIVGSVL
ncbi:Uncharacterized aldehyde oxidase, molybdopterin-binding subunit [Olavius sp. associated proteobacterium Delta 1]|nr:Uncharacterized aldehyde oxidase, molybdopterin-binding subunit [Olavius sp. associated proteobacterium Delta 1]